MQRQERFPSSFEEQLLKLVRAMSVQILKKFGEDTRDKSDCRQANKIDGRQANQALAHLLKKSLSLMNRGFSFRLISHFLDQFSLQHEMDLSILKFEFLEIICSHEHFVALNLPSLRGSSTRGYSKNSKGRLLEILTKFELKNFAIDTSRGYIGRRITRNEKKSRVSYVRIVRG